MIEGYFQTNKNDHIKYNRRMHVCVLNGALGCESHLVIATVWNFDITCKFS